MCCCWALEESFTIMISIPVLQCLNGVFLFVRNMGNFNLFLIHVLSFFHHVKQCSYLSFLAFPTFQDMTSHVANVIYAHHNTRTM